jgi:sortase A
MTQTAFPGEIGNAVISGHRTTYGAPFWRLDELGSGDQIDIVTLSGLHEYRVTEVKVVKPTDLLVTAPTPDQFRLTLTTCHPRLSARQRLIVVAQMVAPAEDEAA